MDKAKFNEARWHILAGIEVLPEMLKDYERIQDENNKLSAYKTRVETILATLPEHQQKHFWMVGGLDKFKNGFVRKHLDFEAFLLERIKNLKESYHEDVILLALREVDVTKYFQKIIRRMRRTTENDIQLLEQFEQKIKDESGEEG